MKRSIIIIAVLTFFVILTNITFASDVDDVKAVIQNLYKALNNADAQAYAECVLPEISGFPGEGGLLTFWFSGATTSQDVQNRMQSLFDAGLKYNLTIHHLDVKVYNNSAIAAYYDSGTTIQPNGDVIQGMFRCTMVCIKQSGNWKVVHFHGSRLQNNNE